MRRTRKKHVQMLSYDGRCHPARSFGPFYGCLARERPGQDAVALFYPHNRCGSTLVFYPGRGPELFALPSLQAGPRYMPRRDGSGLPRTTPEFPFYLESRHQQVVLNTCVRHLSYAQLRHLRCPCPSPHEGTLPRRRRRGPALRCRGRGWPPASRSAFHETSLLPRLRSRRESAPSSALNL